MKRGLLISGSMEGIDLKKKHDKEPDDDKDDKMSAATLAILEAGAEFESEVKMADEKDDSDGDDGDAYLFANMMLSIMEDGKDLDKQAEEIEDMDEIIDDVDATVERLEAIRDTIEKHGISRSMMEIADPNHELVDKGFCCAYEELSVTPMRNADAVMVTEGLKEIISGINKRLSAFFKAFANKLKDFGIGWQKAFKNYDQALQKLNSRLSEVTPNEEKFAKMEVKAYSKAAFDNIISSVTKVVSVLNIETINEFVEKAAVGSVTEENLSNLLTLRKKMSAFFLPLVNNHELEQTLGLKVTSKGDEKIPSINQGGIVYETRDTAGNLGWTVDSLKANVGTSSSIIKEVDRIYAFIMGLEEVCYKLEHATGSVIKDGSSDNDLDRYTDDKSYSLFVQELKEFYVSVWVVIYSTYRPIRNVQSSLLQLTNAALKSSK